MSFKTVIASMCEAIYKKWIAASALCLLAMTIMVSPAHAVCSNNEDGQPGQPGEIEYFTATNELMYCDDTNWILMTFKGPISSDSSTDIDFYNDFFAPPDPSAEYIANAVNFDGTNDYLTRGGALTGTADDKEITVSFWYKLNSYPSSGCHNILGSNPGRVSIQYCGNGTETMQLLLRDTSGTLNTNIGCGPDPHVIDTWYHHLISVDVATGSADCYVNDSDSLQTFTAPTDATLDFTLSDFSIGATTPGTSKADADIADFWIDFGTYIDLSVEANRRKFISASGYPVNLGTYGHLPTGSVPDIFLSGDTGTWHTNDGAGGGFTENGALTDGYKRHRQRPCRALEIG